ncbi:MAG: chemotaxis protein CheW [Silvanigrellales bacterium]|nr:chemotaxis protein CheW [Silvanigrellales bacterium]
MHASIEQMRKVPVGQVWRGFPRTIRDLSVQLGKEVELVTIGDELLIDSSISNTLGDCLVHLLRNSLDHGLETPSDRISKGKPGKGKVTLRASALDEEICLILSDDGRGIDARRIGEKVVEKGLATAAQVAAMPAEKVIAYIFEAGFSTAAAVTDVSGRGVGMDFVRSTLEGLGGRITIETDLGKGTTFTLVVPEPKGVRILNALMVKAAGHIFAIPQSNIEYVQVIAGPRLSELVQEYRGSLVLRSRGLLLSLIDLRKVFQARAGAQAEPTDASLQIVIVRGDAAVFAVVVDDIVDGEEIVVKPLPGHLSHMKIYLGATFLGVDGVCPVFNMEGLAQKFDVQKPEKNEYRDATRELFEVGQGETRDSQRESAEVLTFNLGGPALYGIRVQHVFRLEELPVALVKFQFGHPVSVYRGETVPLVFLEKSLMPKVSNGFDARAWLADQAFLSVIVADVRGKKVLLVVRSIGEYASPEKPLDVSLARGDFEGTLDVESRLVTLLNLPAFLERIDIVPKVVAKPSAQIVPAQNVPEQIATQSVAVAPLVPVAPAFDANGIAEDDGIVWVNVG